MRFLKKKASGEEQSRTKQTESRAGALRAAAAGHASRRGAYSAGLTAIVVAAVIVFNLLLGQIPASKMQLDMTNSQIYNISETSLNYLSNVSEDVEIHVLANQDSVDSRIVRFLDKYVSLSDHLSLDYTDPDIHPAILQTYGVKANTVVVTCAATGRQESYSLDDVFGYDSAAYYYGGNSDPTSFDCEGLTTSAIDGVLSESSRTVYVTTGHGETALPDSITSLFSKNHMTVSSVNLLTDGGVPDDCDLLILNAPTRDLADDERKLLSTYLTQGGQVIYTMASQLDDLPNFEALCADYGMTVTDGLIADTQRYYNNNPYLMFPVADTSVDAASTLSSDAIILVHNSRGMTIGTPSRDSVTVSPFLSTSASGYNVVDESNQTKGTYVVGAVATETVDDGITARLTVYGSDSLCNAELLSSFTNLDNASLFMNSATCGFSDVSQLSIEPVTLADPTNTITTGGLWAAVYIFLIPAAVLIFGFVRWMRRRKL